MRIAICSPGTEDGLPPDEMKRRRARLNALISQDIDAEFFFTIGYNCFDHAASPDHITSVEQRTVEAMKRGLAWEPTVITTMGGIEPGIDAARQEITSVPIVGPAKSTYDVAFHLGARLGLIVYEEQLIAPIMGLARKYHANGVVVGCRAINIPIPDLYPRRDDVRQGLVDCSRQLVDQDGATMIFAQGLSMVPSSMSAHELSSLIGVPVLDGELCTIRTAEMIARIAHGSS